MSMVTLRVDVEMLPLVVEMLPLEVEMLPLMVEMLPANAVEVSAKVKTAVQRMV